MIVTVRTCWTVGSWLRLIPSAALSVDRSAVPIDATADRI